jgi:hypothetical protein
MGFESMCTSATILAAVSTQEAGTSLMSSCFFHKRYNLK